MLRKESQDLLEQAAGLVRVGLGVSLDVDVAVGVELGAALLVAEHLGLAEPPLEESSWTLTVVAYTSGSRWGKKMARRRTAVRKT